VTAWAARLRAVNSGKIGKSAMFAICAGLTKPGSPTSAVHSSSGNAMSDAPAHCAKIRVVE